MKITERYNELFKYVAVFIGAVIFAFGVNVFITPIDLYNGGAVGIAQLIRTFIVSGLNIDVGNTDLSGIIYLVINLPLLFIAFKEMGSQFFIKTIIATFAISGAMTVIPIPTSPIIEDYLSATLIGGIITGFGIGLVLRAGGCGGGIDVLGVYFTKKLNNFSVGKLAIIINVLLYGICAFMFEIPIVIYSIIYTVFASIITDKVHYQNINVSVMIFTKIDGVDKAIMKHTGRGVTKWNGHGAYTLDDTNILVTIANKYELNEIKKIVHGVDPSAFIIMNEGLSVDGNFEKRL